MPVLSGFFFASFSAVGKNTVNGILRDLEDCLEMTLAL